MPDQVTLSLAISRSEPFRFLQRGIGLATFRLNTIVVGLELVADGGDKDIDLPVVWQKPVNARKAREVADQARQFALTSALVYSSDIFDNFLNQLVRLKWIGFPANTVEIVTKALTKASGKSYSVIERVEALSAHLDVREPIYLGMLALLVEWRNRLVHGVKPRSPSISKNNKDVLVESAAFLCEAYSHIDILQTLTRFEKGEFPTRKDTTVLIACCQNLARLIDEAAIQKAANSEAKIFHVMEHLLRERWSSNAGRIEYCAVWDNPIARRRVIFEKILNQMYISRTSRAVSACLNDDDVDRFLRRDRASIEEWINAASVD